jgi:hypothetical protein
MNLTEAIRILEQHNAWAAGRPVVPGSIGGKHAASGYSLLTNPSKMPGMSWSLPAGNVQMGVAEGTCPGAVPGEGSTCFGCYANPESVKLSKSGKPMRRGGNYDRFSVRRAQSARRSWTLDCLSTKEGRDTWVAVMTAAVTWGSRLQSGTPNASSPRQPWFRWHDSGDVFSPRYADMINAVCANLPDVRFWLPTRSWHNTPRILRQLVVLAELPNVAVRPSALKLQEDAPRIDGLDAGTGVKSDGYNCPASSQGNACLSCRKCWSKEAPVYYHLH